MSGYFMGIDIGTSGVRAALFDYRGSQLSLFHKEYPIICTENGMAELDPDLVFNSLIDVTRKCIENLGAKAAELEAIGLSTQLFSFIALDNKGDRLTNLITWADTRPIVQSEKTDKYHDCGELYRLTGCRVQHPMYPLSKILWLKETKPEIFSRAAKFVTIKEYILYRLTGEMVIDYTDASATSCFNIHKFDWDEIILKDVLGISKDRFGHPVDCTYAIKGMDESIAKAMGIRKETPIIVGSGDGILANYGCGVVDDTSMSCTIGTSGALRISVDKPLLDPMQRTWCYCFTRDTWVAGGAINNGGIVLKWLMDEYKKQYEYEAAEVGANSIYELFDRYAAEIVPGCDGLIFLPLLTGERSPYWNANARGTIHGLGLSHGRKHFIRAAMEGVMFRMFSVYEALINLDGNAQQIMANGGYVNSDIWLQIQADIFGKDIAVAGVPEAAVFGAACAAMVGVGALKDFHSTIDCMKPQEIIKPNRDNSGIYNESFRIFKEIYIKLNTKI